MLGWPRVVYADIDDKTDKAVKECYCSQEVFFNLWLALLGSVLVPCIWGLTCGFCERTGDSCYSTEGHMTRKKAPRAPVCESGTWGGTKDTTPGLNNIQREEGEGGRAAVNRQFTVRPTARSIKVNALEEKKDLQCHQPVCSKFAQMACGITWQPLTVFLISYEHFLLFQSVF